MKKDARLGAVFAVLLWIMVAACEQAPDYSKPGSEGKLPEEVQRRQRIMEYSVESAIPSPLKCSELYKLSVTVRQQVFTCENLNYTGLYERAVQLAQARLAELACPDECKPLHSWLILRKCQCVTGLTRLPIAAASVQFGFLCPREGDQKPGGLGPVTPELLRGPFQEPEGYLRFQDAHELIIEEIGDFVQVACPGREIVPFAYAKKVNIPGINDYRPYIKEAQERAKFYYERLSCMAPCQKKPWNICRTEWDFDPTAQIVYVTVYYLLECERPG